MTGTAAPPAADLATVQRRTVRTLLVSQVLGGVGVASGIAVGALLAEEIGGTPTLAGLAQTATVLGAAVLAVPLARLMNRHGRRPGLVVGYAVGTAGAVLAIVAAVVRSYPLLLVGLTAFGGATASNLQARFAATDLAEPDHRGRALSLVVWATTIGTVLGPNLIEPGGRLGEALGIPRLAGPYVFGVGSFVLASTFLLWRLRPDPLLASRGAVPDGASPRARLSLADGLRIVAASPGATLGIVAVAVAHTVMVAVMVMTPIHMHHGGASLQVIGFVISGHVAGMYALSPVMGWLADRAGRRAVVLLGVVLLGAALLLAGTSPDGHSAGLATGLVLLGLGWSACLVAGSTLLTESVPTHARTSVQGTSDLVMGLCGAVGGAVGGIVVGTLGFDWLALAAAPLLAVVLGVTLVRRDPVGGAGLAR